MTMLQNTNSLSGVPVFPVEAAILTPHAPPMLAVDQVLAAEGGSGIVALKAKADAWYMMSDGRWDEVAGVELISQAAAAISGLAPPPSAEGASGPQVCLLAEVRHYQVHGEVLAGDDLTIHIRKTGEFAGFFVTEGDLRRGTELIASAALTFWRDDRGHAAPGQERTSHG